LGLTPAYNEWISKMTESAQRRTISAEISRSWLLVAGTKPDTFSKAEASRADQIILDIEDAVDPKLKPKAREDVAKWLEEGGQAWVRVNDATSSFWRDDLDRLRGVPGLLGIMLAKVEDGAQVAE
jgi:citrate lyase subunit beta/citryl-CoA lyase